MGEELCSLCGCRHKPGEHIWKVMDIIYPTNSDVELKGDIIRRSLHCQANKRWRERHKGAFNLYMRQYMRQYRSDKS